MGMRDRRKGLTLGINGKTFPTHWGEPPRMQTKDLRTLPGGYGKGSGTLARWIRENWEKDGIAATRGGSLENSPKLVWPELVGEQQSVAVAAIRGNHPELTVVAVD